MSKFLCWVGGLVYLGLIVHYVARYGSWWEFGRYGMPRSLVAADGVSHLDGTPIEAVTLSLVRSGREEEVYLACAAVIVAGLLYVFLLARSMYRRYMAAFDRELRCIYGLPPKEYRG
jgi:hypothetical protein